MTFTTGDHPMMNSAMTMRARALICAGLGVATFVAAMAALTHKSYGGEVTGLDRFDRPAVAALVKAKASKAKRHRHVAARTDSNGNSLGTVHTATGKTAKVAWRYRAQFQGLIDDLEAEGYRIDFMGGWRASGTCRQCDAHPRGAALDVNQTARNRVTKRLPADVTAIAARHGLCHGAIWGNADRGHFEDAGSSRSNKCRDVAAHGWPRTLNLAAKKAAHQ